MQHTALRIVLIATLKVILGVDSHIGGRYIDVLVVRDVHTCRVVHLIICTCGDGETADGALAMIEDGIHVRGEHALIGIVHLNGGIGPPQEGLGQRCAVADAPLNLKIGAAGTQREARHALLMEHALHLVHPHRH